MPIKFKRVGMSGVRISFEGSKKPYQLKLEKMCDDVFAGTSMEMEQKISNYPKGRGKCIEELYEVWDVLGNKEFHRIVDEKGVRDNADNALRVALHGHYSARMIEYKGTQEQEESLQQYIDILLTRL